ncbi:MAG TPA: PaaI family thioesterase [Acidimicrobiia bacterium]|nr:PaaI family thioesterase [Acidimicrobiia bacterium]
MDPDPETETGTDADDAEWSAHFVGALGLELWVEDGLTHGRALLRPEMWAPGTDVPRLGVLATMVDVVVGTRPDGPLNPTIDLRITLLARPPSEGEVFLVCRPVKHGRRIFVGEALLHTGDPDQPFARSRCSFMSNVMAGVGSMFGPKDDPPARIPSFDELLHARSLAPGVVAMDAHPRVSNGPGDTIQGGAQALLAEIAAEEALEPFGRYAAVDLEIRYLNRVRTESIVATAEILPGDLAGVQVRVPLHEAGDDGRIVSLVSTTCRAL